MNDLIGILGIDPDDLTWQDLAICQNMPTEDFFDNYENFSPQFRKNMDEVCLSCPVMQQCLSFATDNKENGLWGAVWLTNGKPDDARNSHKSPEIWKRIEARIRDNFTV